jgi:hypothetical protein
MLNDIIRENSLRDRLEELKMLSSSDEMHVSGNIDNKEGLLSILRRLSGGGNGKVDAKKKNEESQDTEKQEVKSLPSTRHLKKFKLYLYMNLHDLDTDYLVIHIWRDNIPGNLGNPPQSVRFELRYYKGNEGLLYFIDKVEHRIENCNSKYYETAAQRYDEIHNLYEVIQQQQDGDELTEIRRMRKDQTEEKWQLVNDKWNNITTEEDYE